VLIVFYVLSIWCIDCVLRVCRLCIEDCALYMAAEKCVLGSEYCVMSMWCVDCVLWIVHTVYRLGSECGVLSTGCIDCV